jgi:hypothetical protein
MKLSDYISISPGFNRSVNINYDLNNPDIISGYIPTERSEEVFAATLAAARGLSDECASIITGSYGTGKSHLANVLGSLLGKQVKPKFFLPVYEKISDSELKELFLKEIYTGKPYLIVTLSGGSSLTLDEQLKVALKRALEKKDLTIQINSSFEVALQNIKTWEEQYPHTFQSLQTELERQHIGSLDSLVARLNNFDSKALSSFMKLYPALTSGANFDYYEGDTIEIYKDICYQLGDYGYRGIFIIYDEFNKILDSSFEDSKTLKTLQDLAELASRSNNNYKLNLMLISHRTIGQYLAQSANEQNDEWRKIEGRFKIFDVSNKPWESYELISRVLKKPNGLFNIIAKSNPTVRTVGEHRQLYFLFDGMDHEIINKIIVEGCIPLHPTTAYILPRISARLAQNERTIFTFLAGKDDSPIYSALDSSIEEFKYILPWQIYDYFEAQLLETRDKRYQAISRNITAAISSLPNNAEAERAILKTIGMYKIVNMPCTPEMVAFGSEPFENAFTSLIAKKLIYVRQSSREIEIIEPVDFDIEEEMETWIQDKTSGKSLLSLIGELVFSNYIIPHGYNHKHNITRFLTPFYGDVTNTSSLIPDGYLSPAFDSLDGIICYLFPETNEEKKELEVIIGRCRDRRVFFALPNQPIPVQKPLLQLLALDDIKELEKSQETNAQTLLQLFIDDIKLSLTNQVNKVTSPSKHVDYYWCGQKQEFISSERNLSSYVSKCMEEIYDSTPNFNNELINKNLPTTISIKARNVVINYLLKGEELENVKQNLSSYQEKLMFETLFVKTDIFNEIEGVFNSLEAEPALVAIENFLLESKENSRDFNSLIKTLTSPPFGIRKGVIPVLLTPCIVKYKKVITIRDSQGADCFIEALLLDQIVDSPGNYSVIMDSWNEAHEVLIKRIALLFGTSISSDLYFANKFGELANDIFSWFTSLPRFSRESHQISKNARAFRRFAKIIVRNPKEVLTNNLPSALGYEHYSLSDLDNLIACIENSKLEIEQSIQVLEERVFKRFRDFFAIYGNPKESLISLAKNMLDNTILINAQNQDLESMLSFTSNYPNYDDQAFSYGLAHALTGIRLEDWVDDTYHELDAQLDEIQVSIEQVSSSNQDEPTYEITISETSQRLPFYECEVTSLGQILQSHLKSALDNFGDAIPATEKKQILLNLLINDL